MSFEGNHCRRIKRHQAFKMSTFSQKKKKFFISSHFSFFLLEHPLVKEWISIVWFPLMGGGEKVRKTREAINKGFHCLKNEHESSSWSFDHFGRGNTQGNTLEKFFQPQATRKHMLSGTSGEIYWMKTRTLRGLLLKNSGRNYSFFVVWLLTSVCTRGQITSCLSLFFFRATK